MTNINNCPFCSCKFFEQRFREFATPKDGSGTSMYEYKCIKCKTHFIFDRCKSREDGLDRWNERSINNE